MSFYLELTCTSDDSDAIEFCAMPRVGLGTKSINSTIDFNYAVDDDEICPRVFENVKLVKFVANQFVILYGCVDGVGDHEEGAWVLGYIKSSENSMKHLSKALGFLKNSTARIEEFKVYKNSPAVKLKGTEVSFCYLEKILYTIK